MKIKIWVNGVKLKPRNKNAAKQLILHLIKHNYKIEKIIGLEE